jgi:4-amino-4-deoxy-L-arabinose transferase-like glycosyltransferase
LSRDAQVAGEARAGSPARTRPAVLATEWLPLAGVLVLALALRLDRLAYQSLTDDEGYSFALAQRNFTDMFGLFRWEGNGTIYSIVLWPLVRISDSLDLLRMPAALAGVAAVAATYWAGRELTTRRVALCGALLLAVSPMAVRYSEFARPFSFVVLFSALSMALLARHLRTGGIVWLAGYAVVLALAAYSNTLAPILLVPVHLVLIAPAGRAAVRRLALAVAGSAVLAAPVAVLSYIESDRRDPLYWLARPGLSRFVEVAEEFMIGRASNQLATVRVAAVLGILMTIVLVTAHVHGTRRTPGRRAPLVAWTFLPLVVALVISIEHPVFFGAYLVVALPGLCLLVSSGAAHLPARRSAILLGVLVLAWGTGALAMGHPPRVLDYRAAAAWISGARSSSDPVIFDPITKLPAYGYYDAALRAPDGNVVVKEWHDKPMPAGVTGVTDPGGYGDAREGPPSVAMVRSLARRTGREILVIDDPYRQGDVEHGAAVQWLVGHCTVETGRFGGIVVLAARGCLATAG